MNRVILDQSMEDKLKQTEKLALQTKVEAANYEGFGGKVLFETHMNSKTMFYKHIKQLNIE